MVLCVGYMGRLGATGLRCVTYFASSCLVFSLVYRHLLGLRGRCWARRSLGVYLLLVFR